MATSSILTLTIASFIAACYSQSGFTFDGGEYKCEGDEVCAGTYIDDFVEISNLICKGFCSCCQSYMTFTCIEDKCQIECEQEDSCADTSIQLDLVESVSCGEPRACQDATFGLTDVVNGFKFECSDEESCQYAVISASLDSSDSEAHMDEFQCDGENACEAATVTLQRLEKFTCEGYRSCLDGTFIVVDPAKDLTVSCEGDSSCSGANIVLSYRADATDFTIDSIECESSKACQFTSFSITNLATETVVIKELKCEGFLACDYLFFGINPAGSVTIEKCICEGPEPYGCLCTSGLDAICQTFEGVWSSGTDAYPC